MLTASAQIMDEAENTITAISKMGFLPQISENLAQI
jgi:hypothetical protein